MSVGHCEICYKGIDTQSYHCKKCYNDFHLSCIQQSVMKLETCPVCREPIEDVKIAQLEGSKESTSNNLNLQGLIGIIFALMLVVAVIFGTSNIFF